MRAILNVLILALDLYKLVIIVAAVMSWLIAFNVVNTRHEVVRSIWAALVGLTEPALRPIRRFLPKTSGIDISPVILFFVILLIQLYVEQFMRRASF